MDLSEALVDLLLVRLGREEERQRVVELLVNELRMTREQARKAVDSTPTVLMEAVPMGQARVIQNRLYPFVDLLPRMDTVPEETGQPAEEEEAPAPPPRRAQPKREETESGVTSGAGVEQDDEPAPRKQPQPASARKPKQPPVDVVSSPQPKPQSDEFVVTSASEEVLSIERCHVCGRTPTGVEKLAPCRSCAEPTCRDCFDRVAHVCQKCASEGKVVDSPLTRTTKTPLQPLGRSGSAAVEEVESGGGLQMKKLAPVIGIVLLLGLGAVLVFVDPLGLHLLGPEETGPVVPDTSTVVIPVDTLSDTTVTVPDTVVVPIGVIDPAGLAALPLPDSIVAGQFDTAVSLDSSGLPGELSFMGAEAFALRPGLSSIAASVPIAIDRFCLFRAGDSTVVLAFAILHPVEDNLRYDLLRKLGTWLSPSGIDEITFYYSENQYYPIRTVSFTREHFADLCDAMGPVDFQNLAGSNSEEVWAVLTGPVQSWLARY
jgi:hypothetical protein